MGQETGISWCHSTWNPVRGCTKISAGCDNCYAETMSHRNPKTLGEWGPEGRRSFAAESYWKQPAKWNEAAKAAGEVHRVFCASLADLFEGRHEHMAHPDGGWVDHEHEDGPRPDYLPMLDRIVETFAPLENLRVLALTKRPWNAARWAEARGGWPKTWWAGCTVENQEQAQQRIPWLLRIPAVVRFVSAEPLLEPVDLGPWLGSPLPVFAPPEFVTPAVAGLQWVIAGGESGSKARPMNPAWARSLRDQCRGAGVAFHHKQNGEFEPVEWSSVIDGEPETGPGPCRITLGDGYLVPSPWKDGWAWGDDTYAIRTGKKAAGRLLDGREWNEVPRG